MTDFSYQLYSSRNFPPLTDTLKMLGDLGYAQVEGYGGLFSSLGDIAALKRDLAANKLTMPTGHFGIEMIESNAARVIEIARELGMTTLFVPAVGPEERVKDAAGWAAFGKRLAEAGKPIQDAGLKFGWHNHAFELVDLGIAEKPLDLILQGSDDLALELDLAWVAVTGEDPLAWITKYSDRLVAAHIKDLAPKGEAMDEDGWADVGHGIMDWPALTGALAQTPVEYLVMEHDNPNDHERFARRSLVTAQTSKDKIMQKLGVGIIGCGNISAAYLRLGPLFKALDLRAVADIDPEAAKARAEEFGVRAQTVDDLLTADDIDVVVNLTIPNAHFAVTKRILEAGKHAYSEKPFVLTLEQGETLRKLCTEKGLRVGSAPDTFLGGAHQQARAMIDAGDIGRVVAGTAHVMSGGMEHWHPNPDFFFLPGAGPVLDIGPYYVTNLIQLIGPIKRVAALTSSASDTRTILTEGPRQGEKIPVKTPTNIHALLEFEQGATITMSTSWDVRAHRHAPMELYGTEGSLFVPDPNFFGGDLEVAGRDGEIGLVAPWDHPFGVPNEAKGDDARANYRTAGLADMAQAISEGRPHRCSLELALHAVDVMTAILISGETGAFVDLSTTCNRPAPLTSQDAQDLLL